jgi:hypothetical protein
VGAISKISCNLIRHDNVYVLMYTDSLNIVIVYGRCTVYIVKNFESVVSLIMLLANISYLIQKEKYLA